MKSLQLRLFCAVLSVVFGVLVQSSLIYASQVDDRVFDHYGDREDYDEEAHYVLPNERVYLRINVAAARLDFFTDGKLIKSYPVAVGQSQYQTPIQEYSLDAVVWYPTWVPPDSPWARNSRVTPPGPRNPLGPVKMLMERGIRIHGTISPNSIGRAASHGCIRMHSEDAFELAWEIQKRHSVKNYDSLLEDYRNRPWRTRHVQLEVPVFVSVEYDQVERKGDTILLHPNRYGRSGFSEDLQIALSDQNTIKLNDQLVRKLDSLRRQQSVELTMEEIQQISQKGRLAKN